MKQCILTVYRRLKVAPASSVAGEITFTVEGVVLLLVSLMMIVDGVTMFE